jgi:hypothetical protein
MKVVLEDIGTDVTLGSNGVLLRIFDNQNNLVGRLQIGKATVTWKRKDAKLGRAVNLDVMITEYLDKLKPSK